VSTDKGCPYCGDPPNNYDQMLLLLAKVQFIAEGYNLHAKGPYVFWLELPVSDGQGIETVTFWFDKDKNLVSAEL
jgi:hypothetical protein